MQGTQRTGTGRGSQADANAGRLTWIGGVQLNHITVPVEVDVRDDHLTICDIAEWNEWPQGSISQSQAIALVAHDVELGVAVDVAYRERIGQKVGAVRGGEEIGRMSEDGSKGHQRPDQQSRAHHRGAP